MAHLLPAQTPHESFSYHCHETEKHSSIHLVVHSLKKYASYTVLGTRDWQQANTDYMQMQEGQLQRNWETSLGQFKPP